MSSTSNMDALIKTINKLQDSFASVGVANPIDLPQIVVIGSQSSGKSSVLENIVGRDFLPRGSGIVTRRPLVLQLINKPGRNTPKSSDDKETLASPEAGEEWGEFLHIPGRKFFNFDEIREEIIADTDAKTGGTKGVSPLPINLRIFSPNVLTLTLVDLPGLTKVPIKGQPADIERQIRDMIVKYISKNNAIILAVTAANTDLANSDGLKLAREVDPEGLRTIGVLTKVDLMDAGTDIVEILSGKVIPLKLGYVPVVNRGQRDVDSKKAIAAALEAERHFFETHPAYQSKAMYCGTPFLARKLNILLMNHIKAVLPDVKMKVSILLQKNESELSSLGESFEGGNQSLLLSIITEFCNEYRDLLEGQSQELSTIELNGGARISFVFHEIFASAISAMDPFDMIKDVDIRTLLYNSAGATPSLFVAAGGFNTLIKGQIKRMEEPCNKCISLVYDELARIMTQLLQKPIFRRFPMLKESFYSCVISFFKRCVEPTGKFVAGIVSSEMAYINTAHPDFLSGHKALAIVSEKMPGITPQQLPHQQQAIQQQPTQPSSRLSIFSTEKEKKQLANGVVGSPAHSTSTSLYPVTSEHENLFSTFLQKKPIRKPGVLEAPASILKATGSLSEREYVEIEIMKLLLTSYFNIVKRTVSDMVPKAIMLNLVNFSKEELQHALLTDLYKKDISEELLKESETIVLRRRELKKMIEALGKANEIISSV